MNGVKLPAAKARPSLSSIIAATWRLKLARAFLWLARALDARDGAAGRAARRIVARCARMSKNR